MRGNRPWGCIAFFFVLLLPAADALTAADSINQRVQGLLNKKNYRTTQFSIEFIDLDKDRAIFACQSDKPLIPASNLKLITTAAAVDQLGCDFAYQTPVGMLGDDLAVIAAGDPLIGDPVLAERRKQDISYIFQQIFAALSRRGVTTIRGDLVIDDSFFDDMRVHPSWPADQVNRWYVAQISAMNFNNNCLDVNLTPGRSPGQPALPALTPQTQYVRIINKCTTLPKGSNTAWGARKPDSNDITLMGACREPVKMNITIDRPSAYFGFVLAEYLASQGITINGKLVIKRLRDERGQIPAALDVLYTYQTPLSDVLVRCNQNSLNMAAECLFKTLGAYHALAPGQVCSQGSWASGRLAAEAFLKKLNVPPDQYLIDDGCGLSKKNRISAHAFTTVLKYMHAHLAAEMFRQSLAEPGEGTMRKKHMFRESRYQDRIMVKTGYVAGTRCMSGYCQRKDGRWLAFSILTNNCPGSTNELMQQIIEIMME